MLLLYYTALLTINEASLPHYACHCLLNNGCWNHPWTCIYLHLQHTRNPCSLCKWVLLGIIVYTLITYGVTFLFGYFVWVALSNTNTNWIVFVIKFEINSTLCKLSLICSSSILFCKCMSVCLWILDGHWFTYILQFE